jgi:CheY-like chemotaxis protein
LAEGLGLTSTGEGVETLDQLTELRLLGCDLAQGFHIARPQLPEAIEHLLQRGDGLLGTVPVEVDLTAEPAEERADNVPLITVVLADDTADFRSLLRLSLRRTAGFDVVGEAADGAMAISVVEARRPEAVVLDLAMPVMDGLTAIPHIRRRSPDTKIIVLSGMPATEMKQEAMAAGADAYIEKGQAPEVLAGILAALCAGVPRLARADG